MNETKTLFDLIRDNGGHFAALILLIVAALAITFFAEKAARKRELQEKGHAEDLFSIRKIAIIGVFSAIAFLLL